MRVKTTRKPIVAPRKLDRKQVKARASARRYEKAQRIIWQEKVKAQYARTQRAYNRKHAKEIALDPNRKMPPITRSEIRRLEAIVFGDKSRVRRYVRRDKSGKISSVYYQDIRTGRFLKRELVNQVYKTARRERTILAIMNRNKGYSYEDATKHYERVLASKGYQYLIDVYGT